MQEYDVIWKPQPKQALAMSCPATELFYGGAAGGGKSDFLLGDFLAGAVRYGKHWRGILFRRTTDELEELIQRSNELYLPLGAHWNGKGAKGGSNQWVFPNGATLKMRYLESEKDVGHYQGHQYTWVGFDELGNYTSEYCWVYMMSRLRSAAGAPSFIRGTANPGGPGHGWIKHRFMDGQEPNKIKVIPQKLSNGTIKYSSRVFIPSRLEDNKVLMDNDPEYELKLQSLPPHLARALRYGDWSVFSGQIFEEFTVATHVVKPFSLEPGIWFKFCSLDWGYGKPFSLGWYAVNSQGRVVKYREMYGCKEGEMNVGTKESATSLAQRSWEISVTEGVKDMVADPAIWGGQDENAAIVHKFEAAGWTMHRGNNDRINGLVLFHDMLKEKDEDGTPMLTVFPTCYAFIRTIPMLTPDPNRPEDVNTKLEDHVYDETRYALMSEFVKSPHRALARQNGNWNFKRQGDEYDPLKTI